MSEEIHSQLLGFLGEAFGRKEHRQAVNLILFFCPPQSREEEMRRWERADRAEIFERLDLTEALIREVINICETHADTQGQGRHKYKVKINEHLGGQSFHQFVMKPSYDPSMAMVQSGGGGEGSPALGADVLAILSANNQLLMRTNRETHESTFRTLANITEDLREENIELRTENRTLRKQVDDLESTKMDREYQFALAAEKSKRSSQATDKLLQFGSVLMAKITGAKDGGGQPDALSLLLVDFGKSLQPHQLQQFMTILSEPQLAMFFTIMDMVKPKQQQAPAPGPGPGGGGPPPGAPPGAATAPAAAAGA